MMVDDTVSQDCTTPMATTTHGIAVARKPAQVGKTEQNNNNSYVHTQHSAST